MAMTLVKALEHLKDSIDCQTDGARSLKSVMRANPLLAPKIQLALESMEKVKADIRAVEIELQGQQADSERR